VFPGRADGGLTERVGFTLSRDFIAHADLMVGLKTTGWRRHSRG
jgi:hypothetical protein